jgi:hypothetical protein
MLLIDQMARADASMRHPVGPALCAVHPEPPGMAKIDADA